MKPPTRVTQKHKECECTSEKKQAEIPAHHAMDMALHHAHGHRVLLTQLQVLLYMLATLQDSVAPLHVKYKVHELT